MGVCWSPCLVTALGWVLEALSSRTLPFPAVWCGMCLVVPSVSSRVWRGPGGGGCDSLSVWDSWDSSTSVTSSVLVRAPLSCGQPVPSCQGSFPGNILDTPCSACAAEELQQPRSEGTAGCAGGPGVVFGAKGSSELRPCCLPSPPWGSPALSSALPPSHGNGRRTRVPFCAHSDFFWRLETPAGVW